jgi:quercetin dioxygenase-like cupin family protein
MKSANILKEIVYNEDKPAITVLFETETTKEIRIAFKSGQHMKKHQTPFPITVEMFDGELDFGVDNTVHHLVKGDILNLNGGVSHDLLSKSNCIVRLTLSKSDTVQRVKDVVNLS